MLQLNRIKRELPYFRTLDLIKFIVFSKYTHLPSKFPTYHSLAKSYVLLSKNDQFKNQIGHLLSTIYQGLQSDDQNTLDRSEKFGFYNGLKIMIKASAWSKHQKYPLVVKVVNTSKQMKLHIIFEGGRKLQVVGQKKNIDP
ncbi:unnamed protein product [Paramecium octaurelia]|uniref:Uncharacterized protein n=1 Tax=Paramecium octaurelia TaxID=43137 RepID=A0A8S1XH49_PAROT|nr:unnamed protein product [Paramecium octaurelia]